MKWDDKSLRKLKELCYKGIPNRAIASHFGVPLSEIHSARSRYNLTMDKVDSGSSLVKCDCCGSLCISTTTYIMPDGVEAELCKHCEAVNDFLAAHQSSENEE
ncbi:MAG: hypothetical protein HP018_07370 [Ruminiclostridium sp.]|jgi:hypothetical protein|nr:hypothetical protein [Ruminiclostridium sp.]